MSIHEDVGGEKGLEKLSVGPGYILGWVGPFFNTNYRETNRLTPWTIISTRLRRGNWCGSKICALFLWQQRYIFSAI